MLNKLFLNNKFNNQI